MNKRSARLWIGALPVSLLAVILFATEVRAETLLLELRPEPGVVARIFQELNSQFVLRQPFGEDIRLLRPGGRRGLGEPGPELREVDFDLDSHDDLAIHFPEARPDDPLQIIRYLPAEQRYETLPLPRSPETICDWRDATAYAEEPRLTLSCRLGASRVTETVRFNAYGAAWLETRLVEGALASTDSYPFIPLESHFTRWDDEGHEQDMAALDLNGQQVYLTIPVPRATLHEKPAHDARTAAYLVRGDQVQLLGMMSDWLRIRYDGQKGLLDRWIWRNDAFDLSAQIGLAEPSTARGLVLLPNQTALGQASGSLLDLFPVTLTNAREQPQSLGQTELHLLFSSEDTGHFWVHSLQNSESLTIAPGESIIVEQAPLVVEYGTYMLSDRMDDEFWEQGELFPFDLPPGEYSVQFALTSPLLDAPLFADEAFTFRFPPDATPARSPEQ